MSVEHAPHHYEPPPQLRLVDLLDHGECSHGHTVADESQTIVYPDRLGRFCRACDERLVRQHTAKEEFPCLPCTLRAEERLAAERDEAIVDMVAVTRRLAGKYAKLTDTEMRVACQMLAATGYRPAQSASILHTSPDKVRRLLDSDGA